MQSDEDVAALKARNYSQAAQIERLLHSQSVARQERDEALTELKHVREELRAIVQARTIEDRSIATAVAEMGASNEKIREALRTTEMRLETARRALEGEREAVGRLQTEIGRLRGGSGGDPYRTVPAAVVDDLRAENERLTKRAEAAEQHSKVEVGRAWNASRAAVHAQEGFRARVDGLQRALNALAREAGVFRQKVAWPARAIDYSGIDKAIAAALATVDSGADELSAGLDLATFFDAKIVWSAETFGPGDRYAGVVEHIRGELEEILVKPSDLTEWIDVVLLAMDGAWRAAGANGTAFVEALVAKDAKNRGRRWPDWRTLAPEQVAHHIEPEIPAGTKILFSGKHEGRVVRLSTAMSFAGGDWYEVDHEPWVEGGPTRITVHRDNMVIVAPKETP